MSWLDLGEVRDLAEVHVNGTRAATLWKKPFRLHITSFLHAGDNELRIQVTNQWNNRLAGDQHLPEDQRRLDSFIARFGRD